MESKLRGSGRRATPGRERKSLRIGVHRANGTVWDAVWEAVSSPAPPAFHAAHAHAHAVIKSIGSERRSIQKKFITGQLKGDAIKC
jgi:hypothetical protein